MAPLIILAIDPGLTTGLAWLSIHADGTTYLGHAEIHGRRELYQWLHDHWRRNNLEVVIESWEVRAETHKKSVQVDPWRIIGYVEGWAWQHGIPFDTQTAAQGKGFGTDEKLRKLGWWVTLRTPEGHARDAGRHLLTYIARHHSKPGQFGHDLLRSIAE